MDSKRTYESNDCEDHLLFIEILENNPNILKNIIKQSEVDNYENGPYIKLRVTDSKNIMKCLRSKSEVTYVISDTYKKMISFLASTLYIHTYYTRFLDVIDIYMNNNAGIQISMEYYLIVNLETIDKVLSDNKTESIKEPVKEAEGGLLSYALSYFNFI